MRPLKITMQAFGPYGGREEIDFTSLGARTMFVISGKTGSGKTTIFDGLSFAIYGKASGEDRSGQELRSQFAEDHVATEVSLEFSLRDRIYKIQRSPQQERKKKNGEGTTTVTAKAELYEMKEDGESLLLGANVRDVDEKIKEIIGLDANQFRQILMIPQGEFRKLLISESKDKEAILQKLFHTEIYKRIEEKLKEDANSLKKQAEANKTERSAIIKDIHADSHDGLLLEKEADSPNETRILSLLEEDLSARKKRVSVLDEQEKEKQAKRDSIQQHIYQGEDLIKSLDELTVLKEKRNILAAKKGEMDEAKASIQLALKAEALKIQEEYYLKAGRQLKSTEEEAENLSKKQNLAQAAVKEAEESYQAELSKDPLREQASAELHRLKGLHGAVTDLAALQEETKLLHQKVNVSAQNKNKAERHALLLEGEEEKLYGLKEETDAASLKFSETNRELEIKQRLLNAFSKVRDIQTEAKQKQNILLIKERDAKNASNHYLSLKDTLSNLEEKWRSSQAGILAALLVEGEPCSVCGSVHHPSPAAEAMEVPGEEELKKVRERLADAERSKYEADASYYSAQSAYEGTERLLQERLESITELLSDFALENLDNWQKQYKAEHIALLQRQKELEAKKGRQEEVLTRLNKVKEDKLQARETIRTFAAEEEAAKGSYMESLSRLQGIESTLPEELRSQTAFEESLKKAELKLQKLQEDLEKCQKDLQTKKQQESTASALLQSSQNRLDELRAGLEKEKARFVEDMRSQGFEKYSDYRNAVIPEEERKRLENSIREYEQSVNTVEELYLSLESKLNGKEKPDLEGLKASFVEVGKELEQLRLDMRGLHIKLQKNQEIYDKLGQMLAMQKELDERYKVLGHLYEIARGQNPFRITFERYVLASFLDDILVEANLRLTKMTGGRYQMIRKADPTRRNVQSGLELSVYDQYTGQERHVKTLSGGESFKAALALALGLADVVQQYSGGVSLETMFIDEGFGTLDPESLDNAVEALIDIQNSGRLVGIISHVPELKERIDARLEVNATQNGSYTQFRFMN
ncbi:AAA family ATPase [Peribacillus kribbensis]|uniref:AAA family ATPase n=1 Tax=Peribacillus kribbensis TaxID=356658 RepID=UPI00040222BF|nr:AAA family ATPase [Peribacillus kribbensis]